MHNIFKRIVTAAALSLLSFGLFGQVPPSVSDQVTKLMPKPIPQSPNMASLGRYGDYNVNYFNGLPEISIALFEAKSGSLTVPISLSYHAAGIRYTDQASNVGLGWSLSAGGQISRSVRGRADELYYYSTPLKTTVDPCNDYYYVKQANDGISDLEADLFSYSFPGKGGKFMIMPATSGPREHFMIPYEPLLVTEEFSPSPGRFNRFEVVDESGVLYRFGRDSQGAESIEFVNSTTGGNTSTSASSWYLTEMFSPNSNDKIQLTYQSFGSFQMTDLSQNLAVVDDVHCNTNGQPCPGATNGLWDIHDSPTSSDGVQLGVSEIVFEGGKVKFVASSSNRLDQPLLKYLDSIEIYSESNGVYTLIKSFKFIYTYFLNSTGTVNLRLKLDELRQLDAGGNLVGSYKFNYHTTNFSWDVPTSSKKRDLWGFYNGYNDPNGNTLLPYTGIIMVRGGSSNMEYFGSDRSTNPLYLKEGVLKKITYPTGGSTTFDYEVHQYIENTITKYAGGLRVTSITNDDGLGNTSKRVFTYGAANKNFFVERFSYAQTQHNQDYNFNTYRSRMFFSSSMIDVESYDGSPVVYTSVTEQFQDAASNNNGKIEYTYDNGNFTADIIPATVPGSGRVFKDLQFWRRGKLTSKKVFTRDDSANPISTVTTSYNPEFLTQSKFVTQITSRTDIYDLSGIAVPQCGSDPTVSTWDALSYAIVPFNQTTGALRPTSTVESTLLNGATLSKTTSITYDNTYLQTLSTSTWDGKDNVIENSRYPFQLTYGTGTLVNAAKGWKALSDKHILNVPIEHYSVRQNGSNSRITSAQVNSYIVSPANLNFVVQDKIYLMDLAQPLASSSFTPTNINTGTGDIAIQAGYVPRVNFTAYDLQGNLMEVAKMSDQTMSYQWGYNNTLPVVEAVNAQNNRVTTFTPTTGNSGITFGGPPGSATTTKTFTVDYTGNVVLSLGVQTNPSYTTNLNYSGITSGSVTLAKNGCGLTTVTFTNVPAGTYTLSLVLTTPDTGVSSLGACGQVTYPMMVVNASAGTTEFYFNGFEDSAEAGVVSSPLTAHTGVKYLGGDYTVNFTCPNTRSYTVEYWYYDTVTSKWVFIAKDYPGPSMVLTEGSAIDDVRIRPKDAQMTTYTYTPGIGMTSSTDTNNIVTYYNYDSFGRLQAIKDYRGSMLKTFEYHYKSQN